MTQDERGKSQRDRRNLRMTLILAAVAVAFYVAIYLIWTFNPAFSVPYKYHHHTERNAAVTGGSS